MSLHCDSTINWLRVDILFFSCSQSFEFSTKQTPKTPLESIIYLKIQENYGRRDLSNRTTGDLISDRRSSEVELRVAYYSLRFLIFFLDREKSFNLQHHISLKVPEAILVVPKTIFDTHSVSFVNSLH